MFSRKDSEILGVTNQDICSEFESVETGEVGRIVATDSRFYLELDFGGHRRTLKRSLLRLLNRGDWSWRTPVGVIIMVLDLFAKVERLQHSGCCPQSSRPFFALWRKWQIRGLLKICEALLQRLHSALNPNAVASELENALKLICAYPQRRSDYAALPRHFNKHLGRVVLWLLCPRSLRVSGDDQKVSDKIAPAVPSPPASVALPMSYSLLICLSACHFFAN